MNFRLEGGDSITVQVGSGVKLKRWTLPKELLMHHSPFFTGALTGSSAETNTTITINLPHDDPKAVGSFVRWMYTGKVGQESEISALSQAWILGGKFGCPAFSDKALLELLDYHRDSRIQVDTIRFAYQNAPKGSKLRKWARDQFLYSVEWHIWSSVDDTELRQLTELDDWNFGLLKGLIALENRHAPCPHSNPELYMEALDSDTAASLQLRDRSDSRHSRSNSRRRSPTLSRTLYDSDTSSLSTRSRARRLRRSGSFSSSLLGTD